ncbi:MAG: phosphoadenosine phosphosulfate sulfotransferase [Coriobacteriia bacterium]|nr:phosphoadenosine phosphosulfate sulfotransferase [Coriobacteriia bacterium]
MKRFGDAVDEFFARQGGSESLAAKARRAAQVRERWATAVRAVYVTDDVVRFILSHVNAVYIMDNEVIVYSDDSLVRSDLDARQEFLKMALNEQGERVFARFKILPSKFNMKTRHPFVEPLDCGACAQDSEREPAEVRFSDAQAEQMVEGVQDETLRRALKRAIMADLNK